MNHLPSASFLHSQHDRVELARQRFFEQGQSPTGVVSEVVFESWARCLRLHGSPREKACFQPVTASRTQLALLKNRALHLAWQDEVPRLEALLGTTSCTAMLTDASGVLIGASCVGRAHEDLMPVATRLGVNLSEDAVGTTAPGVAARTGKAVCVLAGEHFFDSVKAMHCAAAPIRDIRGQLAGVLDLSSEHIPFSFDAAAVVGMLAGALENRLLLRQSTEHLVVRFQVAPELLDSALVGLIGVDRQGALAWQNGVARSLLGRAAAGMAAQDHAGPSLSWPQLAALPAHGAVPMVLPNGLLVWARAEMRAADGHRGLVASPCPPGLGQPGLIPPELGARLGARVAHAMAGGSTASEPEAAEPSPITSSFSAGRQAPELTPVASAAPARRLREADLALIEEVLRECQGNVSDAAKRLGVSRGLIYRRLRSAAAAREAAPAA